MRACIDGLLKKVDNLENRSRSHNWIVKGVKENRTETKDYLRAEVLDNIFQRKLGVAVTSVERIHRLGRPFPDRSRSIILRLSNVAEKAEVLSNAHRLKGTKIFIDQDYSTDVRRKRKNYWLSAAADKQNGLKVTLSFDKLNVWDDVTNKRVPAPSYSIQQTNRAHASSQD